jgi:hypothetical protein
MIGSSDAVCFFVAAQFSVKPVVQDCRNRIATPPVYRSARNGTVCTTRSCWVRFWHCHPKLCFYRIVRNRGTTMGFNSRFAALLIVSLLSASSTAWSGSFNLKGLKGRPDVTCELDATSGLIVVSATAPNPDDATDPTAIWFHFNAVGKSRFSDEKILIARQQLVVKVDSDFPGIFARLYAIKLNPGDYEFKTWSFTQAIPSERTAVKTPAKPPVKLPFKVTAGRVTYLGSFTPTVASDTELAVAIDDQSARDLPVLMQKCPNVTANLIDTQLLNSGPWK